MNASKNPELPHMINLVVGDWSGDGHGQTVTVTILSNIDKKTLEKAYKASVEKIGVNFEDEVAEEYEDRGISVELVEKLAKHGFKIEDYSNDKEPFDGKYGLWVDGYSLAWLFIASAGDPDFKFEVTDDNQNIVIGGYGLLGN